MGKLTRFLWISLLVLALAAPAMAAQVTIVYDEPDAVSNDCDHIRIYYCFGAACTPRSLAARYPASDANCGAVDRSLGPFSLNIPQGTTNACFRVTVTNTAGNESSGVTSCVAVTGS